VPSPAHRCVFSSIVSEQCVDPNLFQSYVALGKEKVDGYAASNPPNTDTTLGSITSTLTSATSTALNTTEQYLASAHSTLVPKADSVKPDIEAAAGTAVGYAETAKDKAQPHIDAAKANVQPAFDASKPNVQQPITATNDPLAPPRTVV